MSYNATMSENTKSSSNIGGKLKLGFYLNTGFTLIEFIAGILSGSLALISDAGHNLTDSLSILISFFGNKIAKREANEGHTYGYGRASILTALLNGIILIILAVYVFYAAFQRIAKPMFVEGGVITIVAFVGILVNGGIALLFRNDKDDLNVRSTYVNMFFDTLASVGALFAGILITLTGNNVFDPVIGILIGVLLVRSSMEIINDAVHVLLDGVPEGIDVKKVKEAILEVQEIKNVDDLHIWALSSRSSALSCHITIENCDVRQSMKIIDHVKKELHRKFNIEHATIETEITGCPSETK